MKAHKNVLIIAYVFPPIAYAGTYRTLRLLRGIQDENMELHVLTIKRYEDIANDQHLLGKVPRSVRIHRTPIVDPWRTFQIWKKNNSSAPGFRYIVKIVSTLLKPITFPDHMVLWAPFAVLKGLEIINENSIDTIYVSSPPHSTQMIGYILKRITGKRLVIDLRDPIIGNVGSPTLNNPIDLASRIESRMHKAYERHIVNTADAVIVNTSTHRSELIERYGQRLVSRLVTIHNSYDPDDYRDSQKKTYDKFTIAHVGSVYGSRKADILFRALRILEQEVSPDKLKINVLFVGLNDSDLGQAVKDHGVEHYVTIRNLVPHAEAISIMTSAHMLLLIKMTGRNSIGQIPGKFFEYLGTGNKILCLGPAKSEVAEIMRQNDMGFTVDDDVEELVRILRNEYRAFLKQEPQKSTGINSTEYSAAVMAKRIAELF